MSPPDSTARFGFIDNLRGLAAIWVVLIHLVPWKSDAAQSVALGPICWLLAWPAEYGRQGVTIFFVISGFVIARSLRRGRVTPRFFGNFVLRRSIRLDPPYWVSIALMLAVQAGLAMLGWRMGSEQCTISDSRRNWHSSHLWPRNFGLWAYLHRLLDTVFGGPVLLALRATSRSQPARLPPIG